MNKSSKIIKITINCLLKIGEIYHTFEPNQAIKVQHTFFICVNFSKTHWHKTKKSIFNKSHYKKVIKNCGIYFVTKYYYSNRVHDSCSYLKFYNVLLKFSGSIWASQNIINIVNQKD